MRPAIATRTSPGRRPPGRHRGRASRGLPPEPCRGAAEPAAPARAYSCPGGIQEHDVVGARVLILSAETVATLDGPDASAIAVRDGRVAAVGDRDALHSISPDA